MIDEIHPFGHNENGEFGVIIKHVFNVQKIDIFSLGVLLFEMLSFAPALRHETNNHTLTQILEPALTHACDRMHEPFTVAKNCYSFFAQHNLISSDNLSDLTAKASLQQ